jgi:hypothetical protein
MADDLRIGSHTPTIDIPASTPSSPASPHSHPGSRPSSPRPSSVSHSASAFGKLSALKDLGAARAQGIKASARTGHASAVSGAEHTSPATKPHAADPSHASHDARFNYGKHNVPSFSRSRFFGFPRPLRTRFPAAWPHAGGDHHANFNRGFDWSFGRGGGGFGRVGGFGSFALPAIGMFLGADLGVMAGAALGADMLMPDCFTPGLGGDFALDMGLGMMGGAALGLLGWEAGRMFNRLSSGPSAGNTYQAHYMHPPYGGETAPHPGGSAPAYGVPALAYHGAPAQGYAYPPQYVPSYPAYSPYPAYGGYNSGPGWGSMFAGAALGGLGFGIGEALGADLMFDAMF